MLFAPRVGIWPNPIQILKIISIMFYLTTSLAVSKDDSLVAYAEFSL
ncbi:hypothetical protein DSBG_0132 [Desulfosporosinus sp. BG]|nr:hypothetical protein DSBG_0132 [Desulfosporosinus sp. BG]